MRKSTLYYKGKSIKFRFGEDGLFVNAHDLLSIIQTKKMHEHFVQEFVSELKTEL